MQEARNTAYKGVVKPVEGTILTVLKDMTTGAEEAVKQNASLSEMLLRIVEAGDESVQNTPELLPVLKQAGGWWTPAAPGFISFLKACSRC